MLEKARLHEETQLLAMQSKKMRVQRFTTIFI